MCVCVYMSHRWPFIKTAAVTDCTGETVAACISVHFCPQCVNTEIRKTKQKHKMDEEHLSTGD